jgi:cellulase/cellobiase CelA1
MVKILRSAAVMASLALSMSTVNIVCAEDLCSITPTSYATAKTDYPDLAFALSAVEQYSIAAWYTDRLSTTDRATMLDDITSQCSEDSRMTIVVYGIPSKDCNAGYSSGGTVSNTADYKTFLSDLTTAVGDRKVLYVVEPDAVGLLAEDGGCGSSAGYLDNLKVAVEALSANANAELYVDVGYWTLEYDSQRSKVVTIMKELATSGTLKGITINTSNYRSNDQCAELCTNFQTAMGSTNMSCVVDTSRNYVDQGTNTDWCNVLTAGIGSPPSSETGVSNLDYFMWVKPPGESDGTCNGGPSAGSFFETGFQKLWDQGYFVNKLGKNTIAEGGSTDTSSSQTTTSSPTKDSSASQTTSSQTTESSASQTVDTTSSQTTDASETEDTSSQTTDSSASQTTAQTSAPETTEDSASQTTEASESTEGEADIASSASQSTVTTAPASTTATPVETTATPTETDASAATATTDAPSQASNCKVKRRLRKF